MLWILSKGCYWSRHTKHWKEVDANHGYDTYEEKEVGISTLKAELNFYLEQEKNPFCANGTLIVVKKESYEWLKGLYTCMMSSICQNKYESNEWLFRT